MKKFDAQVAHDIMISAHEAWSHGAVERLLSLYTDDLTYWCNVGVIPGVPVQLDGKPEMRTFLRMILAVSEGTSGVVDFKFVDGKGHATVETYLKHRRTGHEISGQYLQIATYRGRKICRIDDYHEGDGITEFWRMVSLDSPT